MLHLVCFYLKGKIAIVIVILIVMLIVIFTIIFLNLTHIVLFLHFGKKNVLTIILFNMILFQHTHIYCI
jgi:hypothetical protein